MTRGLHLENTGIRIPEERVSREYHMYPNGTNRVSFDLKGAQRVIVLRGLTCGIKQSKRPTDGRVERRADFIHPVEVL